MTTKLIPAPNIAQRIHLVRSKRIMLDRDLATLYGVTTGNLNKAMKRNLDRFPADFMFQLTAEEARSLRFQFGSLKRGRNIKYLPHAFTQEGVAMLSSVLRSQRAVRVNIAIMRAFVQLRDLLDNNRELARRFEELETRVGRHDGEIREIIEAIRQLLAVPATPPKRAIGFQVRERRASYKTR
jgi:DNA-binding transcriptional MerR regulator